MVMNYFLWHDNKNNLIFKHLSCLNVQMYEILTTLPSSPDILRSDKESLLALYLQSQTTF